MKRLLSVVLVLLVSGSAVIMVLWHTYQGFLETPLKIPESGFVLDVEPGSSIRSVAAKLEQQGMTRADWRWRLLGRLQPLTIKTGEYRMTAGMLPAEILTLLASGKVMTYRFTIVEGWSVIQLLQALDRDPVLQHLLRTPEEIEQYERLPTGNPEGWFLPETYVFVRGDSDLDILRRAYADMQTQLTKAWLGRDEGLPYETQYELLIMASIVEKETSLATERAAIAGVFTRRLLKRWRLETDPTVIYGMGESYRGNIRRKDLKKDTPYNTYTRHGLPPTPIALPGLASIAATAHPADGDAMFFVADGTGGHTFSTTLEQHNKAVKRLIQVQLSKLAEEKNKE